MNIRAMVNLATLLQGQGKPAEAEPLHLEALRAQRATLGAEPPDSLGSMDNLEVPDFHAQELANALWAMTKAGAGTPVVFEALCEAVAEIFHAQELANTLWAMAMTGSGVPAVIEALCVAAAEELTAQELDNTPRTMAVSCPCEPGAFKTL